MLMLLKVIAFFHHSLFLQKHIPQIWTNLNEGAVHGFCVWVSLSLNVLQQILNREKWPSSLNTWYMNSHHLTMCSCIIRKRKWVLRTVHEQLLWEKRKDEANVWSSIHKMQFCLKGRAAVCPPPSVLLSTPICSPNTFK